MNADCGPIEFKLELAALEARVDYIKAELRLAEKELYKARLETTIVKFGIRIGSIVSYRGVEYRVTLIKPQVGKPWLYGNPMKKDGTFGSDVRHLYSDVWNLYDEWVVLTP